MALLNTTRDADLDGDQPRLFVPSDAAAWPEAEQRLDARIAELRDSIFQQQFAAPSDDSLWHPLNCSSATGDGLRR